MNDADWWKAFSAPNMLDAPRRGQHIPKTEVLPVTSESQLATYKAAIEQARQVAEYAQGLAGRAPTEQETAAGIEQAQALRRWIEAHWHGQLTGPEFFDELAEQAYNVGLLSLWWTLSGSPAALCEFLQFMRDWQDKAGPDSIAAMTKAERRESAEWHLLGLAIQKLEYDAQQHDSPRLRQAAEHLRLMLAADKVRPEAPAQVARQRQAREAISKRHEPAKELRARIMAEFEKMPARMSLNKRASVLAIKALKWNRELSPAPFTWGDENAAYSYIRRNIAKGKR